MKVFLRIRNGFIILFMVLCLFGMFYSLYNIIMWKNNVNDNNEIKEDIEDAIEIDIEKENYQVNFNDLKKINPDVVGYIKIKNTDIGYAVVKGTDNAYYLKHNIKKEYNVAGWIFADYNNKVDGTDRNLVIYGHDTKDGSMFGTLHNLLNKDIQEKNENEIIFITENETSYYQIFSTYIIEPEDYYINTFFNSDQEFTNFLNTIKGRTNYDYKVNVSSSDKVLTLSTCTDNGKRRVVIHSRKVIKEDAK